MTDAVAAPLLEVRQVTRRFPGVVALNKVDLTLNRGEVLAVIGENGAGKSTLMKILAGVQKPSEGEIFVDGRAVHIDDVPAALRLGVALIHQELNLSGNLDVGANIFLGREPRRGGLINKAKIAKESQAILGRVGLDIDSRTLVDRLSIGQQQLVEIARALSTDARVLIMDEPTSSLSHRETERLFQVVRELRHRGVSVIFISHRLGEVRKIADRVLVLRDGATAGELKQHEITHDRMVSLMVGRDISEFYAHQPHRPGAVALQVNGFVTAAYPQHPLNFSVRAGEIVGLAGLVGAGRTELLRALFGAEPRLAGEIRVAGRLAAIESPLDAIQCGMALVPEDRKQLGLIVGMAVRPNVGLAGLRRHRLALGLLNQRRENQDTALMIERLNIKTPDQHQIVEFLSGGNQQKVVLAKWLALAPQVLLLDEPTRGIDVGAKREIYGLMEQLAARGVAILFVSSELEEILGMADRALVMHEGRIAGELARDKLDEEAIMRLATGVAAS